MSTLATQMWMQQNSAPFSTSEFCPTCYNSYGMVLESCWLNLAEILLESWLSLFFPGQCIENWKMSTIAIQMWVQRKCHNQCGRGDCTLCHVTPRLHIHTYIWCCTIHCDVIQYEELLAESDGGGTGAGDVLQWCMIMPDANIWLTICIHCTMYATMTDIAIDSL